MDGPTLLKPSLMCTPNLTRKQAEEMLDLLRAQPQKKWGPHIAKLLKALRENANGKTYEG